MYYLYYLCYLAVTVRNDSTCIIYVICISEYSNIESVNRLFEMYNDLHEKVCSK